MQKFYGDSTHWGIGVVEDISDPLNQGRVRVRIHGLHTFDTNKLAIHELPWSAVGISANNAGTSGVGQTPTGLVPGSYVFGVFLDGADKQDFLVTNVLTGSDTATFRQGQELNAITTSLYGDSNPERMYSYFRDILGFTEEEAAGALGAVSQFLSDYTLENMDIDHGEGRYGLGNWNEEETAALRAFASVSSRAYEDFDTQLLFLGSSLQNSDAWPNYSAAGMQLGAMDPSEAADSFAVNVLGISLEADQRVRHTYARQALDAYGSSTNGDPGLYPERGAPTDLVSGDVLPSEEHVYRYVRSLNRQISELIVTDTNTQPGATLADNWEDEVHFLIGENGNIKIGTLANQPVENMPAGTSVTADGELLPVSRFTTSQDMRDQIKRWEGLRNTPYVDAFGYSIGYGYFIGTDEQPELFEAFSERWMGFATSDRSEISITDAQADELFDESIIRFEQEVYSSVTVEITQSQFDALVALTYNLGNLSSSASTLLRNLNSSNYEAAADSFTLYTSYRNADGERIRYPQDDVTRALHGRRLVEAEYFRRGNTGTNGVTLRNHRQFSIVVSFQGGQRHGGGRATSYTVEQFDAFRTIVDATVRNYPSVSVIGLRDLDETSDRPLFDVRQFLESAAPNVTSNPQPAPATVPDTSGVQASASSAGGDSARPATAKSNAKAVNTSKNSPKREPDVPAPADENIPSTTNLDSDIVETVSGEIANLSAPTPPVSIPSPFEDPILGPVGSSSGLGLDLSDLNVDTLTEDEVQQLIDSSLTAYVTLATAQTISGVKTFSATPLVHAAGNVLMDMKSTDNSAVQLRLTSDSGNRRIVARNSSEAIQSQLILDNSTIKLWGTGASEKLFEVDATNTLIYNHNVTIGASEASTPATDAYISVERGTSANVAIRWNETTDTWQLTNDGATYFDLLSGTAGGYVDLVSGQTIAGVKNFTTDLQLGGFTVLTTNSDTDDVDEGLTNLYYTQARFDSAFTAKSTSDLSEGSNLYYTQTRFDTAFGAKSTSDLGEGTNLYYTTARANVAIDARVTQSFVNALNVDADTLDGINSTGFVRGDGVDNGATVITANDADFIVQDSTDTTSYFIFRDHSAGLLYLGTSAAVPTLRASLNVNSNNVQNVNEITAASSGLYLTADDVDFVVRDSTDTTANFIWRDWSASRLYLGVNGSADVYLRSDLNMSSYDIYTNGGTGYFESVANQIQIRETDAALDAKQWTITANNETLTIQSRDDSYGFIANLIEFDRSGGMDISGDVIVQGDLTVNGTTTTLNTTELQIEDNIITLNSGVTGVPSLNAGIEVERGTSSNVAFRWNESTDTWQGTSDGSNYYDVLFDDGTAAGDAATLDGLDSTQFLRSDVVDQVRSGSDAYMQSNMGSTTLPGFWSFHSSDGTRRGYIGWGSGNNTVIHGQNGFGWVFNGTEEVVFTNDLGVSIGTSTTASSVGKELYVYGATGTVAEFQRDDNGDLIEFDGFGYSTFLGMDGSRTYIRNDSGSRAFAIGVNSQNNFEIAAGGGTFTFRNNAGTDIAQIDKPGTVNRLLFNSDGTESQVYHQTATANSYVIQRLIDNTGSPYFYTSPGTAVTTQYIDFDTHIFRNNSGVNMMTLAGDYMTLTGTLTATAQSSYRAAVQAKNFDAAGWARIDLQHSSADDVAFLYQNSSGEMYFRNDATTSLPFLWNINGTNAMELNSSGELSLTGGVGVSTILDEDTMSSNSATALATQQSIKAYVDSAVSGGTGDAGTLDGLDSSQFLRSDQNDTFTGTSLSFGATTRQMINLWGTGYGIGVQSSTTYFRSDNNFAFYAGGTHSNSEGDAGGGTRVLWYQNSDGNWRVNGDHAIWHEGNDGAGSGLDADTVDSLHASQFLRSDQNDTLSTSGNTVLTIESLFSGSTTGGLTFNTVGDTSAARITYQKSGVTQGIRFFEHNATGSNAVFRDTISGKTVNTFGYNQNYFYGHLELNASTPTLSFRVAADTQQGRITYYDTAGNLHGSIQYDVTGDYLRYYSSTTSYEWWRFDSNGLTLNNGWLTTDFGVNITDSSTGGNFTNFPSVRIANTNTTGNSFAGIELQGDNGTSVLDIVADGNGTGTISGLAATAGFTSGANAYLGTHAAVPLHLTYNFTPKASVGANGFYITGNTNSSHGLHFVGGDGRFFKPDNQVFYFDGCSNPGGGSSFWDGLHIGAADIITESAANRFPRASHYWQYTTPTDPTDLMYNIEVGNVGTIVTGIKIAAANDGPINLNGGEVNLTTGGSVYTFDSTGADWNDKTLYDVSQLQVGNNVSAVRTDTIANFERAITTTENSSQFALYNFLTCNASVSGLTADRSRISIYARTRVSDGSTTADSNVTSPIGLQAQADISSGHCDFMYGSYNLATVNGGSDSNANIAYAATNECRLDGAGSTISQMYGTYSQVRTTATADQAIVAGYGVRSLLNHDAAVNITTYYHYFGNADIETGASVGTMYGIYYDAFNLIDGTVTNNRPIWIRSGYTSRSQINGRLCVGGEDTFTNASSILHVTDPESSGTGLHVYGGGGGGSLAYFQRNVGGTGTVRIHAPGNQPLVSFDTGNTGTSQWAIGNASSTTFRISNGADLTTSMMDLADASGVQTLSLDGKQAIRFDDGWIRLNPSGNFTSGIYCGSSTLRTDGQLQVGGSGGTFLVNGATITHQGNTIWTAGNDGAASGLDADLLDGVQGANYVRTDVNSTISGANLIFADNAKADFGTSQDIQVCFNGTNFVVNNTTSTGSIFFQKSGVTNFTFAGVTGDFTATGNVTANSDINLKDIMGPVLGSGIIDSLEVVDFLWKKNGKLSRGVIAQDVELYAPWFVVTGDDGIKSVDYGKLAVAAVYEEKKKREALEDRVDELEAMVKMLMEKLDGSTE